MPSVGVVIEFWVLAHRSGIPTASSEALDRDTCLAVRAITAVGQGPSPSGLRPLGE